MNLLALDIGNSRLGWMLYVEGVAGIAGHAPEGEACRDALAACREQLNGLQLHSLVVAAACVKPDGLEVRLAPLLSNLGGHVHLIGRDLPAVLPSLVREPEKTGADRLAAALGALTACGKPVIVVDAGTAVTVDLVDAQGRFCGGAILPGLRTQLWSLKARTAQLPEVEIDEPPESSVGRDTVEAIRGGVYFGLVGAIDRLVTQARAVAGPQTPVAAAGGDGLRLAQFSQTITHIDEHLVCRGVYEWVRRAVEQGWRPRDP